MYTACIFCNAQLGSNQALEDFPVGRRIAYDEATGRLWVICRACERWNLSPLETRWEAIEAAEKLFRETPLKVSSGNIGLAQTREGLELVRVGSPPKAEMTAWRYGDQFGRRRRRYLMLGGGSAAASLLVGAVGLGSIAGIVGAGVVGAVTGLNLLTAFGSLARTRSASKHRIYLHASDGRLLRLKGEEARRAALIADERGGWRMEVHHHLQIGKAGRGVTLPAPGTVILAGDDALRAMSRLMPYLNGEGGSRRHLRDAVDTIASVKSADQLIQLASVNDEARKTHLRVPRDKSIIGILPHRIRLAMEMTLHEDDERRAMEGELAALETRWREADSLARVADSLLLPESIEQELQSMRRDVD